jgi:putative chitinase
MPISITAANITAITKHAKQRIISGIVDNQQAIFDGGIDTPLRLCHFIAQLAHESAHFQVTLEFASGKAYEGRKDLGNDQPGDGPRYRGRGLIQTTGRANYRQATIAIRRLNQNAPDFEKKPEQLEQFPWALLGGITYWQSRKINSAADRDDVVRVTELINGGHRGLEERKEYLVAAKKIWLGAGGAPAAPGTQPDGDDDPHPVLRRGSDGPDVIVLQNELVEAGFKVLVDGDFGQNTEDAVRAFQTSRALEADGIVGRGTWDALRVNRA